MYDLKECHSNDILMICAIIFIKDNCTKFKVRKHQKKT